MTVIENREQKEKLVRLAVFSGLILVTVGIFYFVGQEDGGPQGDADLGIEQPAESDGSADLAPKIVAVNPSFDVVRIGQGGTGVIAGRATAGSFVEVLIDERVIGSETADMNGEWVLILMEPLPPGTAELSIRSKLRDGTILMSDDVVVVEVPQVVSEKFVESNDEGVVAVLTPRDGQGASRVLQRPGAAPVGEIGDSLALDTLDYDEDGQAVVSGRAIPRSQVVLYLDNKFWGSTKANDDGYWTVEPQQALASGRHLLRIDQVLDGGDVQLRIELSFMMGDQIDLTQQQGKVVVRPGNNLWHIARRVYGTGSRFTLIFQNNADQIRDPDLIYPGQMFDLPKRQPNPQ